MSSSLLEPTVKIILDTGCDGGERGACTVLVNDVPRSFRCWSNSSPGQIPSVRNGLPPQAASSVSNHTTVV
jgi:hypothetical protein